MESLKTKSRIVTFIVGLIITVLTAVSTMTPEGLAGILPPELAAYASIIIVITGFIVNQYSEEKRVIRAEELAVMKSTTVLGAPLDGGVVLNEEYVSDDSENSDEGC